MHTYTASTSNPAGTGSSPTTWSQFPNELIWKEVLMCHWTRWLLVRHLFSFHYLAHGKQVSERTSQLCHLYRPSINSIGLPFSISHWSTDHRVKQISQISQVPETSSNLLIFYHSLLLYIYPHAQPYLHTPNNRTTTGICCHTGEDQLTLNNQFKLLATLLLMTAR